LSLELPASGIASAKGAGWSGLARYVVAATLARMTDGGAIVAVVLLVTVQGGSGNVAGFLGACLTAPHLLGPFIARRIDLADDGRKVIAWGCVLCSVSLAAAFASYGRAPFVLTGVLLVVAGCCGPLMTGGISTRLPTIAGGDQRSQRRAQGWDVATYGIGGTVGPSVVAAASAWASPRVAGLLLAGTAFCAAWLVMRLPYSAPEHGGDVRSVPGAWQTVALMVRNGRLRRTLYMTMLVAFGMAALPIAAVYMTSVLGVAAASAAAMTAAYGIGNLSGSVGVMLCPLRGEPDRLMTMLALCVIGGLIAVMMSRTLMVALLTYWIAGALNAFFFAATLAARTEYALPKGHGQVFLWVAAMKITAGSAGTAVAGLLVEESIKAPLILGVCLIALAVLLSFFEQSMESGRSKPP